MRIDQLSPITGEFILRKEESAFRAERLPVTIRNARMLFALVVIANLLYLVSDWRFHEPSPLYLVVMVRAVVVAMGLACVFAISKASSFAKAEAVIFAWALVTCPAVGVLVSTHNNTALFVIIMAPSVCWLLLPASFRVVAGAGVYCSVVMLFSYVFNESEPFTMVGLGLVMLVLNAALAAAALRSNRLTRLEWVARERERRARDELAESRHALQRMLMCVPVPLLVVSKADGRLVHANEAAVEFLGGHPEDIGMHFLSDLRADVSRPVKSLDATEDAPQRFEGVIRVADGSSRDVLVAARVLKIDGVEHVLVAGLDITDRKLLERRLAHLAIDGFAHRPRQSRWLLLGRRRTRSVPGREPAEPPSLLMIDMDHFKAINDTYGHETGDVVLRSFAKLCRRLFRARDIIGRIGGEEFAVLLPYTSLETALARAEKLRAGAEKLRFRGRAAELNVTASIGVTELLSPGEGARRGALARRQSALCGEARGSQPGRACRDEAESLSKVA